MYTNKQIRKIIKHNKKVNIQKAGLQDIINNNALSKGYEKNKTERRNSNI